jgi:hypothetical protein
MHEMYCCTAIVPGGKNMKWNRRTILILAVLAFLTGFFGRCITHLVYNEDDKVTVEKFDTDTEKGYKMVNLETGEVSGERLINGKHQVWVQVPGEGENNGHWEDDLDWDGVPASIDDDDNDPEVGDEDPDNP